MRIKVYGNLGVEEQSLEELQATLAPNPATDRVMVSFYNPTDSQVRFELMNLQGQILATDASSFGQGSHQFEMSLPDVAPGFYLIRVSHNNGWCQTLKLIKK